MSTKYFSKWSINFFLCTDKVHGEYNQSLAGAYTKLMNHVQQTLLQSAYSEVNLAGLFASLARPKSEGLSITVKE